MMNSGLKSTSSAEKPFLSFEAVVAVLLTLVVLIFGRYWAHKPNQDTDLYYTLWLQHILSHGRWASLEGSYANYSPPYLYILSAVSLLNGRTPLIVIIKLAQVPGMIASSWLFWSICRKLGCSQTRSLLAAWIVLVVPEVIQNTVLWGQCDMIHTACLLGMVRLLLARRPAWAMTLFGVALAFKLQAIFAGAAVAALFLAGEVPLWSALCVPLGYVVMLVPAWLAGRPWKQLLLIYSQQYDTWPAIAMHVANPYQLAYHFSRHHMRLVYPVFLYGGILLAVAVSAWLVFFLARSPWRLRGQRLVLAVAASLLMEPYLLPKMHDRYFFAGDTFVLLLAMMRPKLWIPAAMLQVSALIVAYPHLFQDSRDMPTPFYILPALLNTVALAWVGRLLLTGKDETETAAQPATS
jgi:Gpi18-like mannosyltransferase